MYSPAVLLLLLLILPAALSAEIDQKQVISGKTYIFQTDSPAEGTTYIYLWTASAGSPLISDEASFRWTAPTVARPAQVSLELLAKDEQSGCTNYSSILLTVNPPELHNDLTPILECVNDLGNGEYLAVFGYLNENQSTLAVPVGEENRILPDPADRGQPANFLPGRHRSAFQIQFHERLEWILGSRSALALPDSPRCSFSISGRKFNDLNANGIDNDEPGLEGWRIQLKTPHDGTKTSSTDREGNFSFGGLAPGNYELTEVVQEGWTQSFPSSGGYSLEIIDKSIEGPDFGNFGQPKISLDKSCIYTPPVKIGDIVTYTYNVTNSGKQPLKNINLNDTQNWGTSCVPILTGEDDGNGLLDPGESWVYLCRYTIPEHEDEPRLSVMAANRATKMAATLNRLQEMRVRLEMKLQPMITLMKRFDQSRALKSTINVTIDNATFTCYNYTNPVTEESLNETINAQGNLAFIEYKDPTTDEVLLVEYGAGGTIVSQSYYSSRDREYLKIKYDTPSRGLNLYTVIDRRTGDSLILILDASGNVISKQYQIVPGEKRLEEKLQLKNLAIVTAEAMDGQIVSDSDSFTLDILRPPPVLVISKTAEPSPVISGELLNYTIRYENAGNEDAHEVLVRENYDRNLSFVSSVPSPDAGTEDCWSVGTLRRGESGVIRILVRTSSSLVPGERIQNRAEVVCLEGANASTAINTTIAGALLNVTKTASRELVSPNQLFNYTITVRNEGSITATQVNISDYLDKHVEYQSSTPLPAYPPSPSPSCRHLRWMLGDLQPGALASIEMEVEVRGDEAFSGNATTITNTYRADCQEAPGLNRTLETLVVRSLWILKSANRSVAWPGTNITYTIRYGNEETDLTATDVTVADVLPEVELLSAIPGPDSVQNNVLRWHIGNLSSNQEGEIKLTVHIPKKPDILFDERSSIYGQGYAQAKKRLSTSLEHPPLINKANITGNYSKGDTVLVYKASSCSKVVVAGGGTEIETSLHGSGYYREDETARLRTENKSVKLDRDLFASYQKTSFDLPAGRSIEQNSLWSDLTTAHNWLNDGKLQENYLYARTLEKNSSLFLDMNQTVLNTESSMNDGLASISYTEGDPRHTRVDIQENYQGSFRIKESIDSYGESLEYTKSVRGQGFVDSDKRLKACQRSFEHGSGYYRSDEIAQLSSWNKDLNLAYAATNGSVGSVNLSRSSLWKEGMSTKDPKLGTLMEEEIGYATEIHKETEMGPSYLSILGGFNGTMDLKATLEPERGQPVSLLEERLAGSYQMDTAIAFYRNPKHLYAHLSISKEARREAGNIMLFLINVTNDGNRRLSGINVTDRLPYGMTFFNSSIRPTVRGQNISWNIMSLDVSRTLTIKLRVTVNETARRYVNLVNVTALNKEEVLSAANSTSLIPAEFICCQQDMVRPGALGYSNATEKNWTEPGWGLWRPAGCFNVSAGEFEDCYKAIDDYYRQLDENWTCSDLP
ncbi:MAG: DUF11 domain-containing protein [Methanotrichaceae archaeon]|nr:DUF11 domain-containing protein [Methanotrichaceae archaeon]